MVFGIIEEMIGVVGGFLINFCVLFVSGMVISCIFIYGFFVVCFMLFIEEKLVGS